MIGFLLARIPWIGTAVKVAPWALAGLAMILAIHFRGQWQACRASVAIEAAKAAEKVAAAKEADAKFTRVLEEQLQPIRDAIRDQARDAAIALSKVKSDPNCVSTPAGRAFDLGVRPGGQQAGPRPPGPARP